MDWARKVIVTAFVVFTMLTLSGRAFASNEILSAITTDIHETPKISFNWNEIPYLFSKFNFWKAVEKEVWVSPTLNSYTFIVTDDHPVKDLDRTRQEILNTLPQWNNRKEIGVWTWFARANNGSSNGQMLTGTFTITPEPISSCLFLIGGAALFARFNCSKKAKS